MQLNQQVQTSNKFLVWIYSIQTKQVVAALIILSFAISLQCIWTSIGKEYTRYNNFVIFKYSFDHLIQHKNLYIPYPGEYNDLYKYSPSFALFMGIFNWMPQWLGMIIFNLFNICVFIAGLSKLGFDSKKLKWILLFLFVEAGISMSSVQTNLLIAGCIMLAFSFFEKGNLFMASLLILCTVFVKIFGVVAFALFLLYPGKIRFILFTIFWLLLIGALPLLVNNFYDLKQQYQNWWNLLKEDHSASLGISFMGWMNSIFGLAFNKLSVVLGAAIIFCVPFLKFPHYKSFTFRLLMLSSVLIWIVIFNHKGESSTYAIAMAGVAIWYFSQPHNKTNLALLFLCLIFTSFSATEGITPLWIQRAYVSPYSVKAIFCSIVWFKLILDVMFDRYETKEIAAVTVS
jgi:hypothetical protein